MYTKEVMEHFQNPKNMGELKNPDGIGEVGNPVCGDVMKVTIKVDKNKIKDIKFKTYGCIAAIAATSVLTEMVKNKTLEEAEKITNKTITKELSGLPAIKEHCSVLAADALKKAIEDYKNKFR